ncbi:hypothetical protein ACVWZ3_005847 [Bradyrhizobium sp. i1.3.6]
MMRATCTLAGAGTLPKKKGGELAPQRINMSLLALVERK